MPKLSLSVTHKIERQIRKASTFQYIASNKSNAIVDALKGISIQSGMAIYVWYSDMGLVNVKSKNTPLPSTKTVLEALKYASRNHYFAVYVFPSKDNFDLLEIKSTLPNAKSFLEVNENTRFLFLIGEDVNFSYLKTNAEEIVLSNKNLKNYKLRDGKWVLSDA